MSEEITQTQEAQETQETHGNEEQGFEPITTQEEFDRRFNKRWGREKAKYSDYDQLKADSAKLGTVVAERDDYKSQLDTANAELATLRASEQKRVWASEVAQETGVPADVLRGETKEEMEAHAKTLEKYVKVSAPVVSGDGRSPNAQTAVTARDQFAAALEGLI